METRARTLLKALTWQVSGLLVMTALAYLVTGSIGEAGGLALLTTLVGFLSYLLHERLWQRISWGRGV